VTHSGNSAGYRLYSNGQCDDARELWCLVATGSAVVVSGASGNTGLSSTHGNRMNVYNGGCRDYYSGTNSVSFSVGGYAFGGYYQGTYSTYNDMIQCEWAPSPPPALPPSPPPNPSPSSLGSVLSLGMFAGWTWFSLNVEADDMSVAAVFSSLSLVNGDYLKDQTTFTDYYEGYGFFGGLAAITTSTMYKIKLASSASLSVSGAPTALPMAVTLSTGWTWLPCPYQAALSLSAAAPSFAYTNGDQFKGQSHFSEYYDGYGWFGTLTTLEPGSGYQAKVAAGGSATFQSQ